MPQLFAFQDLIERYSVAFDVETVGPGAYDDLGEWVDGVLVTVPARGALIPIASRAVYESGGRINEKDRQLIKVGEAVPLGATVVYKTERYKVESWTNHGDYGDFEVYLLKHVSVFNEVAP